MSWSRQSYRYCRDVVTASELGLSFNLKTVDMPRRKYPKPEECLSRLIGVRLPDSRAIASRDRNEGKDLFLLRGRDDESAVL